MFHMVVKTGKPGNKTMHYHYFFLLFSQISVQLKKTDFTPTQRNVQDTINVQQEVHSILCVNQDFTSSQLFQLAFNQDKLDVVSKLK